MSKLEKFKAESLKMTEQIQANGGEKNDNSCGIVSGNPTSHISGNEDSLADYSNDDGTIGDRFLFVNLSPA